MCDLVWLSWPPSPVAPPLYKLRFHRCSQKHPENAQQSSEWSTYACSIISSDIYIQLFKSPSQVIVLGQPILLQLYWGIQHLHWNPHAHMKVPFIRRECVSLWVFRIGPDTRATCWQLTPTDASQIRGNAEPSLIYDIFLNFTGRQQDTPLGMMGAWKRWKGRHITSGMGRRIFPEGQQPWCVDRSGPGAPNALFPKEKQQRATAAMLENPL